MNSFAIAVERNHRIIIIGLLGVIAFFLFSCTFHDVLPICHWLFGCDHMVHV